jgi:hypothetical protein
LRVHAKTDYCVLNSSAVSLPERSISSIGIDRRPLRGNYKGRIMKYEMKTALGFTSGGSALSR